MLAQSNPNVISCKKCRRQGVGEAFDAPERIGAYIEAAGFNRASDANSKCSIIRHFLEPPIDGQPGDFHTIHDLSVVLVEKFPVSRLKHNWLYLTTMRKRGEARWIRRLEAQLNTRRQVWNLFSGCEAARGDPNPTEADDRQELQV